MRSQSPLIFAAIVLASAFANANAPGDQYRLFDSFQTFIIDNQTSLQWQRSTAPKTDHSGAQDYCTKTGNAYRLPTVRELLTLVDEDPDPQWDPDAGMSVPTHIDPNAFPNTPADVFWTMSPHGTNYKVVNFADGQSLDQAPTTQAYVRCVVDAP